MIDPSRPRSPLWLVVLAQLVEGPMHPYRMQALIKERGKDLVANAAQRNSVYQAIDALLRSGLIAVREIARDENRPERTVYEITDQGKRTLQVWLHAVLSTPAREFPDFPAALSFAMMLEPSDLRAQLEIRASAIEKRLAELEVPQQVPRLFLLEVEYMAALTRAELAWLRGVIADLRSRKLTWSEAWLRKMVAKFAPPEVEERAPPQRRRPR
jgi:DNA-binding PadR family transcriptional regulator